MTPARTGSPAADALPVRQGEYRRLSQPVFPDPISQPGDYLSDGFSLPRWLVQRWLERCGFEECLRLGFWFAVAGFVLVGFGALLGPRNRTD